MGYGEPHHLGTLRLRREVVDHEDRRVLSQHIDTQPQRRRQVRDGCLVITPAQLGRLGSDPGVPSVGGTHTHAGGLEVHLVLEPPPLGRGRRSRVREASAAGDSLTEAHGGGLCHRRTASGAGVEQVVARWEEARRVREGRRHAVGARVGRLVLPRQGAERRAASVVKVAGAVAQYTFEELGLVVAATLRRERLVHMRHHREVRSPCLLGGILLRQELFHHT